jgi:hypothetical protein
MPRHRGQCLDTYRYEDTESLLASLEETVAEPANAARAASIKQDKERLRSLHRQSGKSGRQTINSSSACKAPSTVEAKNVVEVKKQ